jgi:hypothetical protein
MAALDDFVTLSVALTGIDAKKLAPDVDPINVRQEYFDRATQGGGAAFTKALAAVAATPPATLVDVVLNTSGDDVRFVCRSIILMWLTGSWYAPDDLKRYASANPPSDPIASTVISPKAYTQGWVWSAAQAHPMGHSNLRFGYWQDQPPPLAAFVGP